MTDQGTGRSGPLRPSPARPFSYALFLTLPAGTPRDGPRSPAHTQPVCPHGPGPLPGATEVALVGPSPRPAHLHWRPTPPVPRLALAPSFCSPGHPKPHALLWLGLSRTLPKVGPAPRP